MGSSTIFSQALVDGDIWFENERIRVFNVMLNPGQSVMWQALNPVIRWVVGRAGILERRLNTSELKFLTLEDKEVRYYERDPNIEWMVTNNGAAPARELVFELLDTGPRYNEEQVDLLQRSCVFSPRVGTKILFENERVRAWDFSYPPGAPLDEVHQHTLDYVFCTPCGGPAAVKVFMQVHWTSVLNGGLLPDGSPNLKFCHAGRNGFEDRPFVEYLLELK